MGPVARAETRREVVERLSRCCATRPAAVRELVVFPELALTTFFPRWDLDRRRGARPFFETRDAERRRPSRCSTRPRRLGVGFHLGYAELTARRPPLQHGGRSSSATARVVATYRKVHLPGHEEPEAWRPFQHLERKYFEPGPDGFRVHRAFGGVDRHRALQRPPLARDLPRARPAGRRADAASATTRRSTTRPIPTRTASPAFHNNLVMAAGAYQNGTWVVGVAKGGRRGGRRAPRRQPDHRPVGRGGRPGRDVRRRGGRRDHRPRPCDRYKQTVFDFERYRRP